MTQLLSNWAAALARAAVKLWKGVTTACQAIPTDQPRHYEPELYYMRGPGPKWREKHACKDNSAGR